MSTTEQLDVPTQETVEVRRNAGLAALVGALASAVAIAWLGRAAQSGALLDWLVVGAMALLAGGWLYAFVDARTPLLVADGHGVRVRLGRAWQGLPWRALEGVQHTPRDAWWRDGRLVLQPVDVDHVLGEADPGVRRRAWLNTRIHGAPLAVPLGMATRVVGDQSDDLTVALRRLAQGATAVTEPAAEQSEDHLATETAEAETTALSFTDLPVPEVVEDAVTEVAPGVEPREESALEGVAMRARRRIARMVELRRAVAERREEQADAHEVEPETAAPVAGVEPVRPLVTARRSEVRQQVETVDTAPLQGRELRRDGRVSLVEEAVEPAPVEELTPLEVAEEEPLPRPDPVIGPLLARARERIGLSVDALAERTRIRPHVIEAIEIDDFVPCGGDFYARGHLRTLARILGLEAGPLVKVYDERYADAPINARKVFEAELATGTGGIRAVRGGPNWSVVVAAVMAVVLAWSVAKLAMDDKPEPEGVMSLSQGSGGPNGAEQKASRVTIKLTATSASDVEVRNARGKVIFSDSLETGAIHRIDVVPPVKVHATDGGAVQVEIDNVPQGTVGKPGQQATKKFAR